MQFWQLNRLALQANYPQLTGRLVGRALARSRNLAVNMAIVHQLELTPVPPALATDASPAGSGLEE